MSEETACWCDHPEDHDAFTALGHAMLEPLVPVVAWVDRQLRRWPWLYVKLSGHP